MPMPQRVLSRTRTVPASAAGGYPQESQSPARPSECWGWLPGTGGAARDLARRPGPGSAGWRRLERVELGLHNTAPVRNATEPFILKWLILRHVNFISLPYFVKNSRKTHIKSQDFLTTTTVMVFLIIIMLPCTIYLPFSQVYGKEKKVYTFKLLKLHDFQFI